VDATIARLPNVAMGLSAQAQSQYWGFAFLHLFWKGAESTLTVSITTLSFIKLSITTLSTMTFRILISKMRRSTERHSALWQSIVMLNVIYAECNLCWVSFKLSVIYAECHLCWVSSMLSVAYTVLIISALYADCSYTECRYAECHYADCHGATK
jgi:hypothetical protein